MKIICSLLTLLFLSLIPFAQDSWLQTDKFIYKWNEPIRIRFLAGENIENGNPKLGGIKKLEIYFNGVKDNLSAHIPGDATDSIQIKLLDEGTAMFIFHSNNYYRELDSDKFNKYLLNEKQMNALETRKELDETDSAGRELYQQNAKTIIQVGKRYNDAFKQETSLPVDMLLQQNPYSLKDGDSLEVKILFQKEPLTMHLIRIWQKKNNHTVSSTMHTDENGMIKFPVVKEGIWMISTVKMERITNNAAIPEPAATRWQSYRGSLTWGFQ